MKLELKLPLRALLLLALIPLLSGSPASLPPSAPPPIERARIPPLPAEGRVSLLEIPSECSQGCLNGLTLERERSSDLLMGSGSLDRPANATPTDYSLTSIDRAR